MSDDRGSEWRAADGGDRRVHGTAPALAAVVSRGGLASGLLARQAGVVSRSGLASGLLGRQAGVVSGSGLASGLLARQAGVVSRSGLTSGLLRPAGGRSSCDGGGIRQRRAAGSSAPSIDHSGLGFHPSIPIVTGDLVAWLRRPTPERVARPDSPIRHAVTATGPSSLSPPAAWMGPSGVTRPYGPGVPSMLRPALRPEGRPRDGSRDNRGSTALPVRALVAPLAGTRAPSAAAIPTGPFGPGRPVAQRSIAFARPAPTGLPQVTRPSGRPREPDGRGAAADADRRVYGEAFAVAAAVSSAGLPSALPAQKTAALGAAAEGSHHRIRRHRDPGQRNASPPPRSPVGFPVLATPARHCSDPEFRPARRSLRSRLPVVHPFHHRGSSGPAFAAQPGRLSLVRTRGPALPVHSIGRSSSSTARWVTPLHFTHPYGPGVPGLLRQALSPVEGPGGGGRGRGRRLSGGARFCLWPRRSGPAPAGARPGGGAGGRGRRLFGGACFCLWPRRCGPGSAGARPGGGAGGRRPGLGGRPSGGARFCLWPRRSGPDPAGPKPRGRRPRPRRRPLGRASKAGAALDHSGRRYPGIRRSHHPGAAPWPETTRCPTEQRLRAIGPGRPGPGEPLSSPAP